MDYHLNRKLSSTNNRIKNWNRERLLTKGNYLHNLSKELENNQSKLMINPSYQTLWV